MCRVCVCRCASRSLLFRFRSLYVATKEGAVERRKMPSSLKIWNKKSRRIYATYTEKKVARWWKNRVRRQHIFERRQRECFAFRYIYWLLFCSSLVLSLSLSLSWLSLSFSDVVVGPLGKDDILASRLCRMGKQERRVGVVERVDHRHRRRHLGMKATYIDQQGYFSTISPIARTWLRWGFSHFTYCSSTRLMYKSRRWVQLNEMKETRRCRGATERWVLLDRLAKLGEKGKPGLGIFLDGFQSITLKTLFLCLLFHPHDHSLLAVVNLVVLTIPCLASTLHTCLRSQEGT